MARRFKGLAELKGKLNCDWPAIYRAIDASEREIEGLETLLLPRNGRLLEENARLVVFGSIARGEFTSQSDLDWILLIDGEVDVQHFRTYQSIRKNLREAGKIEPAATGTFGGLTFSHELVHCIGGQDDSNQNLTLRMLLLLESLSIGDDEPRKIVIRAILKRYLADDPSWARRSDGKLPRFLLNDVIRFWRTMAVDFADKFHDQEGEKWGLRNAKLRFSRKLLLLTGMLACFSWRLRASEGAQVGGELDLSQTIGHFEDYLARPPLEILADELKRTKSPDRLCREIFGAYDGFLSILDDSNSRAELERIPRDAADKSAVFQRIRTLSHQFRNALLNWLYETGELRELVKQYALF